MTKIDRFNTKTKKQFDTGNPSKFLGDEFLEPQYIEKVEEKNINTIPELGEISELGNNEKYNQARSILIEGLLKPKPSPGFLQIKLKRERNQL